MGGMTTPELIAAGARLSESWKPPATNGVAVAEPSPANEEPQRDDPGAEDVGDDLAYMRSMLVGGGSFVLDIPDVIPALWGHGEDVLWAEGESLMIAGPPGLGKTTLALQLIHAQLGLGDGTVLGLPVPPRDGRILYLAMDRPRQIARAAKRLFRRENRVALERLVVWQGPPPADIAQNPILLLKLARAAGADTVYLDSVKDAAIGLSDDATGAGYNRARQLLLAGGVELVELHHTVKRGANGGPPAAIADVYGSAWITAGTGSVVLLSGDPGDPIVGFKHVRHPAGEVGPFMVRHDQTAGVLTVDGQVDLAELATTVGFGGLTAKYAAAVLFSATEPTAQQVEKARRRLDKLVKGGGLRREDGVQGGAPARWFTQ